MPKRLYPPIFQPPSAFAIKRASSPHQALLLFKARLQTNQPIDDPFNSHAAVFTLKALYSSKQGSPLTTISHLHAHLLKTNLISQIHVSSSLLHAYSPSSFADARKVFDEIPNRNVVTLNTMISCCCTHGDLTAARFVFNGMVEWDIASWSAMIGGYVNRGFSVNGFSLFRQMMRRGGLVPDELMLVTLLAGCVNNGSLRLVGKSIHGYVERNGMGVDMQLGTKLIDMYARCGCLRSAARVFERIPRRNLVHWTAMICGLANHGHGEEAVMYFDAMKRVGIRPNEITFTGVLNACCHAGLVAKGQEYFCSMVEEFGLAPNIQHYGCVVDLFAKAGRLDDASSVLENMKVEPNIVVLTSLLAGCKLHKNFEIAEKVINRVLAMTIPDDNGGVYTLISDLYAMGNKWNDVERVRKLIDAGNVRKNRGSSFVEMGEITAFRNLSKLREKAKTLASGVDT